MFIKRLIGFGLRIMFYLQTDSQKTTLINPINTSIVNT